MGDTGAFDDFGHDVLKGGFGNDVLTGGASGDILTGGAGADKFVFHEGNSDLDERDQITDFSAEDVIDLSMLDIHGASSPAGASEAYRLSPPTARRLALSGRWASTPTGLCS